VELYSCFVIRFHSAVLNVTTLHLLLPQWTVADRTGWYRGDASDLYSIVPDSNLGHAMTILSVSARTLKQNVEIDIDHFLSPPPPRHCTQLQGVTSIANKPLKIKGWGR
jgi:hypothetical protein